MSIRRISVYQPIEITILELNCAVGLFIVIPAQSDICEALPGGCSRSLVGILKCLVSAFCQGYTTLSEI